MIESNYCLQRSTKLTLDDIVHVVKQTSNGQTKDGKELIKSIEPILYGLDTVMFFVQYDGKWEVLSSDIRAPKVLICGEGDDMSIDELYSNPTKAYYMEQLAISLSEIASHPKSDIDESFFTEDNWHDLITIEQGSREWSEWHLYRTEFLQTFVSYEDEHLTTTRWGQGSSWRTRMPTKSTGVGHCPTGCVPVAVAQMLYYLYENTGFYYPLYGQSQTTAQPANDSTYVILSSSNTTFPSQSLSYAYWSQLPKTIDDPVSADLFGVVSTLMLEIGYHMSAMYYDFQTSSFVQNIPAFLSSRYNISSSYCSPIDFDIVRNQIHINGMPCILGIRDSDDNGHAVIADGAKRITTLYRKYYVRNDTNGNVNYMTTIEPQYSDYVCINWGWSDDDDEVVWYNVSSFWDGYNVFLKLVYGFSL